MSDGSVWAGRVVSFSPDLELEHRELVLGPPLTMRGATGKALIDVPDEFQRVVLKNADIFSVSVQYERPGVVVSMDQAERAVRGQ